MSWPRKLPYSKPEGARLVAQASTYLPFTFYASILSIKGVLIKLMRMLNALYAASKMQPSGLLERRKRSQPIGTTCFRTLCSGVETNLEQSASSSVEELCPSR